MTSPVEKGFTTWLRVPGPPPPGHQRYKGGSGDVPVFDRGTWAANDPAQRMGLGRNRKAAPVVQRYRTAVDRIPAREVVTARLLGDPPAWRAGQRPVCEEDVRIAEREKELASEPERLAPRRYRPGPVS